MKILKPAKAGTLESNDISIMLMPSTNGIEIELESVVEKQFGNEIRETIKEKLEELGIKDVIIKAIDKGALDYTIKARIETAVKRAGGNNE